MRRAPPVVLLLLLSCPGRAEVPKANPPDTKEQRTLEAYGLQNATCEEWSDGCAVCMRQDGAKFACSLPGIACQPSGLVCRREKNVAPEKPAK